jgi:hypothetical protein
MFDVASQRREPLAKRGARIAASARAATAARLATETGAGSVDSHRMLVAGRFGTADCVEYVRVFDLAADRSK